MWGQTSVPDSKRCEIEFCPRPSLNSFGVCEVHWREFLRWLEQKHGRQVVDL